MTVKEMGLAVVTRRAFYVTRQKVPFRWCNSGFPYSKVRKATRPSQKTAEIRRFCRFSPPILPHASGARFLGSDPAARWGVLTEGSTRVPKTEELGTAGHQPDIPGKSWKSVFVNYVRKPASRLNHVGGFKEHVDPPSARGSGSTPPRAPLSFYVPLSNTTHSWDMERFGYGLPIIRNYF
jgi:hypothetical protein